MKSLTLTIFGISSNLAQIKLIPALYDMEDKGLLPEDMKVLGIARRDWDKRQYQKYLYDTLHTENPHTHYEIKEGVFGRLVRKFFYLKGNLNDPELYRGVTKFLKTHQSKNKIFYLATYPDLYQIIFENLKSSSLNKQAGGFVRLMIEKPIGNDLSSAQKLNQLLDKYFTEDQIYRLDHYLGKETIQNILTFRFGNGIFEPIMNASHIDHIQITASEDFGIGLRGGYYDSVGALKDVGQNHLLQMLAFATMDEPASFTNEEVTCQRIKVLSNLKPFPEKAVFGQYQGYTAEENVDLNSDTDTFYALKTEILNERFKNIPIYIRAGKKLQKTITEISVVFKVPENRLFRHLSGGEEPNVLIYRIRPNDGIVLRIMTKKPGHTLVLEPTYMQFCYRHLGVEIPDPYGKLISDTIRGDQTFFNDAEEVEAQWRFIDPLFKKRGKPDLYEPGTWGPKAADELIEADGRHWLEPSNEFCLL